MAGRDLDRRVIRQGFAETAAAMRVEISSDVTERMARYRDDPVGFAREIVRVDPWPRQVEILEAFAKHTRVLVRSGHKIGKSIVAIILALWFVATRPRARVLLTAPSAQQIKRVLWRELQIHWPKCAGVLDGPPVLPLDPATGLRLSGFREIFGRTARDAESLAGTSGAEMLFLVDEASGYPDELYEALKGNAAGGVTMGAFSNPTKPSGWFFEGFRNGLWKTIHVSSEESPNIVHPEAPPIPGLAGEAWVKEMRRECGANYREHPIYQVRVQGNFPSAGPNQIYGLELVENARKRWDAFVRANLEAGLPMDSGIWAPLELGVDPARYGDDDAVIQPRRGVFVYPPRVLSGRTDEHEIAEATVQCVRELRRADMDRDPVRVKIDAIGVGVGVISALRTHEACAKHGELVVIGVDVNEAADDPEKFNDKRAQLWFAGAQYCAPEDPESPKLELAGAMLPPEPKLTQELLSAIYFFDARGRLAAASKDVMRAFLKRSPNHADALNLAAYRAPGGAVDVKTERDLERAAALRGQRHGDRGKWSY